MEDYIFKKLERENIGDLIPIFKGAFNKTPTEAYLVKKYSTGPFGINFAGFIAYHAETNEPAAFYGVFPCLIKYHDRIIHASQTGDTMTHPDHQGKGLFTSLAKVTHKYIEENGVQLMFAFPNQNSLPGFKKLGWKHEEDIQSYLIRIRCLTWSRCKRWFHLPDSLFYRNMRFVLSFCKKGKVPFENSVGHSEFASIYRNADLFSYKTYEKSYVISVKGKSVWIKPDTSFLKIGDMERCTEKEFRAVTRRLKILAFFMGLPYLRYHCSPGVYYEKMFAAAGTRRQITYPIVWTDINSGIDLGLLKFTMCDNDTF